MLELIAKMKSDLEKLEEFVRSHDIPDVRTIGNGQAVKRVYRVAQAGDYITYNEQVSPSTLVGKLYEVIKNDQYIDEEGSRMYWDGWADVKPLVYEMVKDDA